jgi:hypothetical protein
LFYSLLSSIDAHKFFSLHSSSSSSSVLLLPFVIDRHTSV